MCINAYEHHDHRWAVFCDGSIEYLVLEHLDPQAARINPKIVMTTAANALLAAERFRRVAGAPDVEYGLEIEIRVKGGDVPIAGFDVYSVYQVLRVGGLSIPRIIFPRYAVGNYTEFVSIWNLIRQDFFNPCGVDYDREALSLDFDRAFRELGIIADTGSS